MASGAEVMPCAAGELGAGLLWDLGEDAGSGSGVRDKWLRSGHILKVVQALDMRHEGVG